MKDRGWLFALAAGLATLAVIFAAAFEKRGRLRTSGVQAARGAVTEFAETLTRYRNRYGYLPGDLNHDGEIEAGEERIVTIAGRPVTLRAIGRRASAIPNAPRGRNVIELWNLPCGLAQELDARFDDGNLAKGSMRASVAACGGRNELALVFAVTLPL